MKGRPPKPEKVAESESRMSDCLDFIENIWLKDKPFLAGDTISVADILGACEIEQPRKSYISFGFMYCDVYYACNVSNKKFIFW